MPISTIPFQPFTQSSYAVTCMASSEVEVTESSGVANTQNPPNAVAAVDVFLASAYGDLEKLSKFVEPKGASLSTPDANGYYALQWATLNNFADVVQYTIEVVHVVAQHGQTTFLNHIIARYHADYDAPDNDGRVLFIYK